MNRKLDFENNSVLIEQLANGNQKAFSLLVENFNHKLCVYANSLVNDPEKAQDIVQNVFLKTWEKRKSLKRNFSINGFLYRAVHNEFVDQYRSNKSLLEVEKIYMDTILQLEKESELKETEKKMNLVMEAIHELPPKCKQIFLLSKKEGLENIEIAEYLDISRKTVENQITKAFSTLRERLSEKYEMILFVIYSWKTKGIDK